MADRYTIPYEVPASTAIEAIVKASELLRTGLRIERVKRVAPSVPGWWFVDIQVEEPESADPMTAAKAEADRG